MENDYEKQLQDDNEKLRVKLAEAMSLLDYKKNILEAKRKKYPDVKWRP